MKYWDGEAWHPITNSGIVLGEKEHIKYMSVPKNFKIKFFLLYSCMTNNKKKISYSNENNYLISCIIWGSFDLRFIWNYFSLKFCESRFVLRNFKVKVLYRIMKEYMQELF